MSDKPPRTLKKFLRRHEWIVHQLGPLLALVLVIAGFGVADSMQPGGGNFLTVDNMRIILVQTSIVAVAALGMTMVIISGGIDLSAGTALALAATVLAHFLLASTYTAEEGSLLAAVFAPDSQFLQALRGGWCVPVAIVAAMLAGCLAGLVNGLLISLLRIVPFIVTLGTMTIYLGVAKYLADESTVRPDRERIPQWLSGLVSTSADSLWLGLPLGVWIAFALAAALAAVLRYTVFGRYVFALGSNESTARLCGINVPLTKVIVYSLSGLFIGIAGIFQFSRLAVGNPTSGIGLELKIIAAVVIGGGSLSGGQGSVLGTLAGAAIIFVIANGCTLLGYRNPSQDIIIGAIIVAAVTIDRLRQRRLAT